MASIYGLLLVAKGDVKKVKFSKTISEKDVQDFLKKNTPSTNLGSYVYDDYTLTLFGYTTGKAGTENKHELPPPLDSTLYFGDVLLVASKNESTWKTPSSFVQEQYEKFYQKAFGGFESAEDDEADEADEADDEHVGRVGALDALAAAAVEAPDALVAAMRTNILEL